MGNNGSGKSGECSSEEQKQYEEAKKLVLYTPGNEKSSSSQKTSLRETRSADLKNSKGDESSYEEDTNSATALEAIKLRRQETYLENQRQNLSLRKLIAQVSMWAVGLQMFLTNVTFIGYMNAVSYRPESEVMIAWMSSTVVQIVGIALVVAKGIFPQRSGSGMQDEEGDIS